MARDGIARSSFATAALQEDVAETVKVYGDFEGTPVHNGQGALVPACVAVHDAGL